MGSRYILFVHDICFDIYLVIYMIAMYVLNKADEIPVICDVRLARRYEICDLLPNKLLYLVSKL